MASYNRILKRGAGWVLVVRENVTEYERSVMGTACTTGALHELLRARLCAEHAEVLCVVLLDGRNRVIGISEVARGGDHDSEVRLREILRVVLCSGAHSFALAHNHPSGDPTPSDADKNLTEIVYAAAKVVGVPLVDHIVVGSWDEYVSFYEQGLMRSY